MGGSSPPPDHSPAAAGNSFSRLIRLQTLAGRLNAVPADQAIVPASFAPFPMPRLPLTALAWCGSAAGEFQRRRRRCLAIVLLLDRIMRRWVPFLPTQACGRESASWQLIGSDYANLPMHILIAGSFQSIGSSNVFDAHQMIPSFDGIHAVEEAITRERQSPRQSWVFVRSGGGEAELLADPSAIFVDDVEAALRDAKDRFHVISST